MKLSKFFNHDFENGVFRLHDRNGNVIYHEDSTRFWYKREYDFNGNVIYHKDSNKYGYKNQYDKNNNCIYHEFSNRCWSKMEYNSNGNCVYYEASNGYIRDDRPKPSFHNKTVEINGKRYQLKEV